jgi:uncharacterized membrane protein
MDIAQFTLFSATLLCALSAGFVFAFAVVVMPGIQTLPDGEFLRAFQVMDRVIQKGHPLFLLMWVGSVVAVVASAVFALSTPDGGDRILVVLAATVYVIGVQLPTFVVNVPLNNRLQALDVPALDDDALGVARVAFEARWTRWNVFRTAFACLTTVLLLTALLRS